MDTVEQIVLVNANPGDIVPGVELAELGAELSFVTREDVEGFLSEVGYGPDNPDELVYVFVAGDYQAPHGFPTQLVTVPAAEAKAVREALKGAQTLREDALKNA